MTLWLNRRDVSRGADGLRGLLVRATAEAERLSSRIRIKSAGRIA